MRKYLVIGIIFLFISVAFAPSFNAVSINESDGIPNDDLVEVTVRVSKKFGVEKYKVMLTKEQENQLDFIFEDIRCDLGKSESRDDRLRILDNGLDSLNNIGLFSDGTNLKNIKRIIQSGHMEENFNHLSLVKPSFLYEKEKNDDDLVESLNRKSLENSFCSVVARVNFAPLVPKSAMNIQNSMLIVVNILLSLQEKYPNLMDYDKAISGIMLWYLTLTTAIIFLLSDYKYRFGDYIGLGNDAFEQDPIPSNGWIETDGLLGQLNYTGNMFGQLSEFVLLILYSTYIGINGFTGVRIEKEDETVYFYGRATRVLIASEPPDFGY